MSPLCYQENLPEEERVQAMRENTYVRVYGHLRSFAGKRSVVAFKMTPLTDMNELSCHMLEVIHSHVTLSSGQVSRAGLSSYSFLSTLLFTSSGVMISLLRQIAKIRIFGKNQQMEQPAG